MPLQRPQLCSSVLYHPPRPPFRLKDVLFTYEHFDSRQLITYADEVGVTGLMCRTPSGEALFKGLTFTVRRGESMLIMGPSGSGESAQPRAVSVWLFEHTVCACVAKCSPCLG
jgi:ABC-type protease/lipase transport system fused ATPase/permease subunit